MIFEVQTAACEWFLMCHRILVCSLSGSGSPDLFLDCLTSHDECTTLPRNAEIPSPTTQRHIPSAHRHSATSQLLTTTQCHIPTAHQRHSATPQQLANNTVPHPNSSPTTQCHIPTEIILSNTTVSTPNLVPNLTSQIIRKLT